MIHGDIDLTENLDFYRDRKEKDYKNTRDLSNKPSYIALDNASDNASIAWTNSPNIMSSYTYTYNNTTFNTNIISDTSWNNSYLIYNNISDIWDFDNTMPSSNTITLSIPSSQNIIYNISTSDGAITSISMSHTPTVKKSNQCTKLFGEKPVKEYSNYKVIKKFSNKPKKEYKNSRFFTIVRLSRLYSNTVDRYNAWRGNWVTDISNDIDYIFGSKHEPNKKDNYRFSPVPWLEDFAKKHRSLFEDYMEELRGNDVNNDKYLTDYGWLRIH